MAPGTGVYPWWVYTVAVGFGAWAIWALRLIFFAPNRDTLELPPRK